MYIIDSGSLEIKHESQDTNVQDSPSSPLSSGLSCLGAGQSFGEEILLGFAENYEYSVVSIEKTKLEMIIEDDFLALFLNSPNVLDRMRRNALEMNPQWAPRANLTRQTTK